MKQIKKYSSFFGKYTEKLLFFFVFREKKSRDLLSVLLPSDNV